MSNADANENTAAAAQTSGDGTQGDATPPAATTATVTNGEPTPEQVAALGDPGKQALDRMKAARDDAQTALKTAAAELEQLRAFRAQAEGKQAEYEAAKATQQIKDEALAAANSRILKAEVRALAAGKMADPADALHYIDLSAFKVGESGEVDNAAISAAIADLVSNKPYLAAQGSQRFQGSVDGGARNDTPPATVAQQIADAEKAGDFKTSLALKAQLLIDSAQKS